MEKNRGIIRELLKFEFELDHSKKEAMDNINKAKGNGTVNRMTVWRWFSKFRNNQMDIADKKRVGRPREIDRVAVVNAVEDHPSMQGPTDEDKHNRSFKTWVGSSWSTRRTAQTWPQVISTYSDLWNTGCAGKSSE
jgi:hypothetical protein